MSELQVDVTDVIATGEVVAGATSQIEVQDEPALQIVVTSL